MQWSSTSLDEDLGNFCMALHSRHVQWSKATLVFVTRVSTSLDEDLSNF